MYCCCFFILLLILFNDLSTTGKVYDTDQDDKTRVKEILPDEIKGTSYNLIKIIIVNLYIIYFYYIILLTFCGISILDPFQA